MIMLILRHAWLNLWDKHMTTGRINQVSMPKEPHKTRILCDLSLAYQKILTCRVRTARLSDRSRKSSFYKTRRETTFFSWWNARRAIHHHKWKTALDNASVFEVPMRAMRMKTMYAKRSCTIPQLFFQKPLQHLWRHNCQGHFQLLDRKRAIANNQRMTMLKSILKRVVDWHFWCQKHQKLQLLRKSQNAKKFRRKFKRPPFFCQYDPRNPDNALPILQNART